MDVITLESLFQHLSLQVLTTEIHNVIIKINNEVINTKVPTYSVKSKTTTT